MIWRDLRVRGRGGGRAIAVTSSTGRRPAVVAHPQSFAAQSSRFSIPNRAVSRTGEPFKRPQAGVGNPIRPGVQEF